MIGRGWHCAARTNQDSVSGWVRGPLVGEIVGSHSSRLKGNDKDFMQVSGFPVIAAESFNMSRAIALTSVVYRRRWPGPCC
jgi:hypothetical protein